jgi:hypothetical protein
MTVKRRIEEPGRLSPRRWATHKKTCRSVSANWVKARSKSSKLKGGRNTIFRSPFQDFKYQKQIY